MRLSSCLGASVLVTMLTSAATVHILRPNLLVKSLRSHELVRMTTNAKAAALMATGLVLVEFAVAVDTVASLTRFGSSREAALAAFALGISFLAYLLVLLRWRPGVNCGCNPFERRVSGVTLLPTLFLIISGFMIYPSETLASWLPLGEVGGWRMVVAAIAGSSLGLLVYLTPAAVADSSADPVGKGHR